MKAVFLDRDGVINHDPGDYTCSLQEFTLLPGVVEQLTLWSNQGYAIAVITNQGGIAKGRYTLSDFLEIDAYMISQFEAAGINFLGTYFCPHHPDVSKCICRKPGSALIERAIVEHGIDNSTSFMIGDKLRDIECAKQANVRAIWVPVNSDLRALRLP